MFDPWGFALIIFEAHHAAFPVTYTCPVIPTAVLTDFNRQARAWCKRKQVEYTHDIAICHASEALGRMLQSAVTDNTVPDSDTIAMPLLFISHLTNYRFWTLTFPVNGSAVVATLNGATPHEAESHAREIVGMYQRKLARPMDVYLFTECGDDA